MKTYYLETFGCKLNQTDSERIKLELNKNFKPSSLKEADIVVFNTCGVVEKTERKIFKRINQLKNKAKQLLLPAACL